MSNMAESRPSVSSVEVEGHSLLPQYNVLTSIPLIVERIFTFLPMKDLHRISVVCQLWAEMAKRVKSKRQQLSWLLWLMPKTKFASKEEMVTALESHLMQKLNSVSSEPTLAIAFASATDKNGVTRWDDCTLDIFHSHFKNNLPRDCRLFMSWTTGIVGTKPSGNKNERSLEAERKDGYSCLLLPKIPGVKTEVFGVKLAIDEYPVFMPTVESILKEGPPKALLLFTHPLSQQYEVDFVINLMLERWGHTFALGGGMVDDLLWPNGEEKLSPLEQKLVGIAFYGERVKAASIVVKRSVKRRQVLDEAIQRLKQRGFPEERSFAFMFACVGRGKRHWKGKSNVEADAFRAAFPNTPLFGFFGSGEIGIDSSSVTCVTTSDQSDNMETVQVLHAYTTIFVLVSIC